MAVDDDAGPLAGVRVLDLSRHLAGNILTVQLADFGAEVLKIEDPAGGDTLRQWREKDIPFYWKVYARNKKSVALDLRTAAGRAQLLTLARSAAILVESNRPGVLERLGLGPDRLWAENRRLVIVRLTGWGQSGPYSDRPGFGTLVEALSGFAEKNGSPDGPPILPNLGLADSIAGLHGASAALMALRNVEVRGGRGQIVDVSLLDSMTFLLGSDAAAYAGAGVVPRRMGNRGAVAAPRNVYRSADGHGVALAASTQGMTERLLRAIGRAELVADPRFVDNSARLAHVEELDAVIQDFIGRHDLAENVAFFRRHDVTAGPVYGVAQFSADPHVLARQVLVTFDDPDLGSVTMPSVTPRLSETPGRIRTPAPRLGQHDAEILGPLAP
jgi:crotonobetainyl-CoA:carnitine CoA-transferase CaiB-like acyl-CoA transferase